MTPERKIRILSKIRSIVPSELFLYVKDYLFNLIMNENIEEIYAILFNEKEIAKETKKRNINIKNEIIIYPKKKDIEILKLKKKISKQ